MDTTTIDMFNKLIGKDLWVLCNTAYGLYYIHPVLINGDTCTYRCVSKVKLTNWPEDLLLSSVLDWYHKLNIQYFDVITPIQLYSTAELIEPICNAQGLDLAQILEDYGI